MLGKLLKYDIKSMTHTFVPLFIAMLGMSILNILFFQNEWIAALIGGGAIMAGLLIALLVTTIVMIITQFYHSVLGDQGYLTNTLPVSVDTILFSKMISATVWIILSGITAVLSGFILLAGSALSIDFIAFIHTVGTFFSQLAALLASDLTQTCWFVLAMVLGILLILASIANELLHFYCAMACSQLYPFTKNRVAGSVIAYLLISIPLSVVSAFIMAGIAALDTFSTLPTSETNPLSGLCLMFFLFLVSTMLLNVLLYLPSRYILKNKLNLE